MNQNIFWERLQLGEIVAISAEEWDRLAHRFEPWQSFDAGIAGQLLLLRGPTGLVAVEQPQEGERVVRPLPDEKIANKFIQQRLDSYERMWDG